MKRLKFLLILVWVAAFGLPFPVWAVAGQAARTDIQHDAPQGVGSLDQYRRDYLDSEDSEFHLPLIGVSVRNAVGKLASGQPLRGLGVTKVKSGGPADMAGVRGEQVALQTALILVFFGASIIFPPAVFVAMVVAGSDLGHPRDVIIAVDGIRTRDVFDFENVVGNASVGEIIYLTIVRDGRRHEFRVGVTTN